MDILEVLVSGRLGGVPGGESRFRLLAIIREAAAGSKRESPVEGVLGRRPGWRRPVLGLNEEGAARVTVWLYCPHAGKLVVGWA